MANPTVAELAEIRNWVPETWTPTEQFDDGAVFQTFARLGSVAATIAALVRRKLQLALENPDTFSIPGDYSQSNASNIAALREQLKKAEAEALRAQIVTSGAAKVLVRPIVRQNSPGR